MEKEFNRNQRSYRPRRDDNREDYQSGRNNRSENRRQYAGDRRFRNDRNEQNGKESDGNRPGRFSGGAGRRTDEQGYRFRSEKREGGNAPERRKRPRIAVAKENGRPVYPVHKVREEGEKTGYRGNRRAEEPGKGYRSRKTGEISEERKEELRQKHYSKKKILAHRLKNEDEDTELRLNRYIAMSGICSRRDADELILAGRVKVNGNVVQMVGQKVKRSDRVELDDKEIVPERKIYLVLNKPKGFVTTVDDPLERKTVMSLVEDACKERIYPVGRLDRQTTGVLLFTNDGDLAKKLTHPKYDHKKIYHVFLDKPLREEDFNAIASGIELEDGFIKADEIEYTSADATQVGIEIHSGKNRIVRRIFEHFGYQIQKLDRVYFAGITKKKLPRGKWRFLTPKEVNMLKVYQSL